jgi:hypothetical protein
METKKRTRWTEEMLIADAARFETRGEWQRESKAAYQAAFARNLLDVCCAGMRHRFTWTDEMLIADAKRFETRREWQCESRPAYQAAFKRSLLDVCCGHMRQVLTSWTDEMLIADAKRFETRSEWERESGSAYNVARGRNLLDVCCGHMRQRFAWTDEMLIADAKRFETRSEWLRESSGAYKTAVKRNLLGACCDHMERAGGTDNDAIYIWRAIGETFNGEQVYKVGVTSARLGTQRIEQVCKRGNMQAEIIILAQVSGRASKLELQLMEIGTDPGFSSFDGSSEFRAMTDEQLSQAVRLVSEATQENLKEAA